MGFDRNKQSRFQQLRQKVTTISSHEKIPNYTNKICINLRAVDVCSCTATTYTQLIKITIHNASRYLHWVHFPHVEN